MRGRIWGNHGAVSNRIAQIQKRADEQLPLDPGQTPAQELARYKRFLKDEFARLKKLHRGGGLGREVCEAHAAVIDALLGHLLQTAVALAPLENLKEHPPLAVVATGGYGRSELNPQSDIDIQFLCSENLLKASGTHEYLKSVTDTILYTLWDVGLKVGHAVRRVTDCVEEANKDMQSKTALIESLGSGLTTYDYYWFGYTDIDSEGVWVWTDGYTGTYTRWSPGEPNNAFDADCASTYNGDRWDDRGCGSTTETEGFVCAYRDADADGIPSTNDCDDTDPAVGSNLDDADCDGASTSVDCDDNDPTLGSTVDDLDCDGAVTAVDCDDLDPLVGTCFSRVGAGGFHSCGIDIAGGVVWWGAGAGESGGACNVPLRDCGQSTPPPGSFVEVDAGSDLTSCGLELGGTIQCWGYDDFGQATPPAGTFSQVDVGDLHACALDDTGVAVCWGNGVFGTTNPPSGVPLQQLSTSGKHTCAITTDSLVVCWGNNQWGESSPPPGTFLQVSGGSASTCGIRTNGQIACWGRNNVGQSSPPSGAFVQVDQGNGVGCALDQLGEISCWGLNTNGEATPPAGQFTELSVGNGHACAIDSIGALQCWGRNEFNQSTPP